MDESAEPGGRSAKMRRTRIAITEHSRTLTAEHGLNGFTIEEVCERVGISRRTFFNYFPSKEEAVIGSSPQLLESEPVLRFLAEGTPDGRLSPTLLDEIAEVAIELIDEVFQIAGTITHVHAIIAREPSFMGKFLTENHEVHQRFIALLEQREGLAPGDARAALAMQIVGAIMHDAVGAFMRSDDTGSVGPAVREALAQSRELFTGTPPPAH